MQKSRTFKNLFNDTAEETKTLQFIIAMIFLSFLILVHQIYVGWSIHNFMGSWVKSLFPIQVAHQARADPGFCSMKWLGVFLFPLDGMLVHHRVSPSGKHAGTHLYTWVERGTLRVKCLVQEHKAMSQPGLEPKLLAPESSTLTIRPPHLPHEVLWGDENTFETCNCSSYSDQ